LGEQLGEGVYFDVFDLKRGADDKIIKIMDRNRVTKGGDDPLKALNEMNEARQVLKDHGIEHPDFKANIDDTTKRPYLIQDKVPLDNPDFHRFPDAKTVIEGRADLPWTKEHQVAVLELFKQLAENKLIWEDAKVDNMFFRRVDGKLKAGILDIDRISKWDSRSSKRWNTLRLRMEVTPHDARIRSLAQARYPDDFQALMKGGTPYYDLPQDLAIFESPKFFMAKVLEYQCR